MDVWNDGGGHERRNQTLESLNNCKGCHFQYTVNINILTIFCYWKVSFKASALWEPMKRECEELSIHHSISSHSVPVSSNVSMSTFPVQTYLFFSLYKINVQSTTRVGTGPPSRAQSRRWDFEKLFRQAFSFMPFPSLGDTQFLRLLKILWYKSS